MRLRGLYELVDSYFNQQSPSLLLFDIDGTLIDTGRKGMKALKKTAIEIFGEEGPPLDLAGATDLGILRNIYAHFALEWREERNLLFFETYHAHLKTGLSETPSEGRIIPGATEFLEKIRPFDLAHRAILTGNTHVGAWTKLSHYGLDHHFTYGAYGSDHADRDQLGPIAIQRAHEHSGLHFTPNQVLVIGDTPKDISCAHACGAKCLAVSTGQFTREQLVSAGADWVVDNLLEIEI